MNELTSVTAYHIVQSLTRGQDFESLEITQDLAITSTVHHKLNFRNCVFKGVFRLSGDNEVRSGLTFENCTFLMDVIFDGFTFNRELQLNNSEFNRALTFRSVRFQELRIENCKTSTLRLLGDLNSKCIGYRKMEISDTQIADFEIDCEFVKSSLSISKSKIKKFNFASKIWDGSIELKCVKLGEFWMDRTTLEGRFDIDPKSGSKKGIHVSSCNFKGRCQFEGHYEGNFWFHKVKFAEQVIFTKKFICNDFSLRDVISELNVSITYNQNISRFELNNSKFQMSLDFWYHPEQNDKTIYEYVDIDLSGPNHGDINFYSSLHPSEHFLEIGTLGISGANYANISFQNISNHFLLIQGLNNHNRITFNNFVYSLDRLNVLVIEDSNLGYTEFMNFEFSDFNELVIVKSNLSNTLFTNSTAPKRIQTRTRNPKLGFGVPVSLAKKDSMYLRETFRQLKITFEKQSNRHEALVSKSREMYYLRKEMKFGWNKVLLFLNYISNNHGISWSRGIAFTLLTTYLLFHIYLLTTTPSLSSNSWMDSIKLYPKFLASFPRMNILEDEAMNWKTHSMVFLIRIIIGFGIYQTVAAFRKFGK